MSGVVLALLFTARAEPPPVPPPRPPVVPSVWTGTLGGDPAGMPVAVVERHGLPLVRVELSFDTTAIRHRLAPGALYALGAVWRDADTRDTLERLGADVSIGCGAVRCWSVLEVPVEGLREALVHTAAAVRRPTLEGKALADWRRDTRREWRTDWLGPGIVHARAFGRLTWPEGHPYRLDRAAAAFRVQRAAVREAWRVVVAEAPVSVVVAGDVVPADVLPLVEVAYGGLGGRTEAVSVAAPAATTTRRVLVDAPGANQALVSLGWPSPTQADADHAAYTLAFQALAGGFASRLNLRLREDDGLTYRVDGAYVAEAGYGWSEIELATDPDQVARVLARLSEELDRARTGGFTDEEVTAARHRLWVQGATETSTLAGVARMLWRDRRAGREPGASMIHLSMYQDVSLAEVGAAAAAWLAGPRTWLVSGDADTLEPVLETAGWATDTVWGVCQAVYGGACPR
ncbi:MAG: insulinase family protein [Myxococcota bacterium]